MLNKSERSAISLWGKKCSRNALYHINMPLPDIIYTVINMATSGSISHFNTSLTHLEAFVPSVRDINPTVCKCLTNTVIKIQTEI